jgi:hypothetical protein
MDMQGLETNLIANTEGMSLAVVCLLGAGFMVWFLIDGSALLQALASACTD